MAAGDAVRGGSCSDYALRLLVLELMQVAERRLPDWVWSFAAQAVPAATAIVVTPFLLSKLGVAQYGLYAFYLTCVTLLTALDGGVGASLLRFFSRSLGENDPAAASRLLGSAVVSLAVAGTALSVASVALRHVPAQFLSPGGDTAIVSSLIGWAGPTVALILVGYIFRSLLQAQGRWRTGALLQGGGSALYACTAVALVARGHDVRALLVAYVSQQALLLVASAAAVGKHLSKWPPRLQTRSEYREFVGFAGRMQVMRIISVLNSQSDALVIAVVLSPAQLGYYAIGAQFATQLRLPALAVLGPLSKYMSETFGRSGRQVLLGEFPRLQLEWARNVGGYAILAAVASYFLIMLWLGPQYRDSAVVAVILATGSAMNLCTGAMSTLVQALGLPQLEVRYGAVVLAVNVLISVPLALGFGLVGVVAGTAIANLVASPMLVRVVRTAVDPTVPNFIRSLPPLKLTVWSAVLAVALSLMLRLISHGALGLVAGGIVTGVCVGVYLHTARR